MRKILINLDEKNILVEKSSEESAVEAKTSIMFSSSLIQSQ
jgi:hypothetical protein